MIRFSLQLVDEEGRCPGAWARARVDGKWWVPGQHKFVVDKHGRSPVSVVALHFYADGLLVRAHPFQHINLRRGDDITLTWPRAIKDGGVRRVLAALEEEVA